MKKLSLAETAHLAEVVAAAAVVLSLVYVGRGLEANTAAVQGAAIQAITATHVGSLLTQASDSELTRIRIVGDRDPSALNEIEAAQYWTLRWQIWIGIEHTYFQHEQGLVDDRTWAVYNRVVCSTWVSPGVREIWPGHRELLDSGFVGLVERCPAE